jgi:hypothetical protein
MAKSIYLGGKALILPNSRGGEDIKRAYLGGQRVVGQQYPLPASSTGDSVTTVDGFDVHQFTSNGTFTPATTLEYEIFMVGAGDAGDKGTSTRGGGGGGGGEVVVGSIILNAGTTYSVNIGAFSGDNTTFAGVTAYGGGQGGRGDGTSQSAIDGDDGNTGGAGTGGSGGGGAVGTGGTARGTGGESFSENGIVSGLYRYGNDGGPTHPTDGNAAGGGGGAGGQGGQATDTTGGDGGGGIANNWLGSTTYYGGGGGGFPSGNGSAGGASAPSSTSADGNDGTANTGGGGSGNAGGTLVGDGGSGIVLIRYRKGA